MAQPRMRIPGGTYLVTNTTSDRRFLFKPCRLVAEVILYCLFRAARKHGVLVHAVCVASNHFHLVVTDTEGNLSAFMHWVDLYIARCLLIYYRLRYPGRTIETLWSPGSFNQTLLVTREAISEALDYCVTNPVRDGLVASHRHWPGLCVGPEAWLLPPRLVARPPVYFSSKDPEHAEVECAFTMPPQFADRTPDLLVAELAARVQETEHALRRKRGGKPFLGTEAVLATDPFDSPDEPRPTGTRNPTVKAGPDPAAYRLAIAAVRAFREAYRAALHCFCAGKPSIFPSGTLQMRDRFGVPCAPDDFGWCCRAPAPG